MITKQDTSDFVLMDLRKRIILREYEPEQFITEGELADYYNISRGPVREVLKALSNEGILTTCPNGRRKINKITYDFVNNLFNTRKLLEVQAVKEIINSEFVKVSKLITYLESFQEINKENNNDVIYKKRFEINENFHKELFNMSENIPLQRCWVTIEPIINAFTKLNAEDLDLKNHHNDYIKTHQKILEYLMNKDPEILNYMVYHIDSAKKDALKNMRNRIKDFDE